MIDQDIAKELLYIYCILINILSFICFYVDKRRARRKEFRISESFLFIIAFLGGALGSILGMKIFKHKTKRRNFIFGIPLILLLNIVAFVYLTQFLIK